MKYSKSFQTSTSDREIIVKYSNSFQTGISNRKIVKYSKYFQTKISDRKNCNLFKVFSDRDIRQRFQGFQTNKIVKNSKSFQIGIPDRENCEKFKIFSDRDSRQGKIAKKRKSLETSPPKRPLKTKMMFFVFEVFESFPQEYWPLFRKSTVYKFR